MKRLYNMMVIFIIFGLIGCDANFEPILEPEEFLTKPSTVSGISAESLPGQILLKWDVPADKNYYFLRVSYYDSLAKKDLSQVASAGQNTILIDNTRARYGDYEFKFQTFNSKNEGSEVQTFKAKSGKAPATETVTRTKIALTEDQLSTNNPEPTEGPIRNLIDGNVGTMFHTRWSSPQIDMPQYIQINLKTPIQAFQFYTRNRNGSQEAPAEVEVQISNDGKAWNTISTITSGIPSGSQGEYTSEVFRPGNPFNYFRYNVLRTNSNRKYFNLAEFELYDVLITIYDPETDEKD